MRENLALLSSCVTGAALIDEVEHMLQAAGFIAIRISRKDESKTLSGVGTRHQDRGLSGVGHH